MLRVKVPATSANLGSGFDAAGLALDICNEYAFSFGEKFSLSGFAPRYLNLDKNLVLSTYRRVFEICGRNAEPVSIEESAREIPRSGGLGSSAACIVAGAAAANFAMGNPLSENELFDICALAEGHPDNAGAAIFGGLTVCTPFDGGYLHETYSVSDSLSFAVLYPDFSVSTAAARAALPETVGFSAATANLARVANLPRAMEKGDFRLLRECVKDRLHEPFRMPLIKGSEKIRQIAENAGKVAVVSGSGAAMLVIGDEFSDEFISSLTCGGVWRAKVVKPNFVGAKITVDN